MQAKGNLRKLSAFLLSVILIFSFMPTASFAKASSGAVSTSTVNSLVTANLESDFEYEIKERSDGYGAYITDYRGSSEKCVVPKQISGVDVVNVQIQSQLFNDNPTLKELDLSLCTALVLLNCDFAKLTSLNVSNCVNLQYLDCMDNQLTSLNVSSCVNLQYLNCQGNQLTSLDISSCVNLQNLDCQGNQLTSLDVSKNAKLVYFSCINNHIADTSALQLRGLHLYPIPTDYSANWNIFPQKNSPSVEVQSTELFYFKGQKSGVSTLKVIAKSPNNGKLSYHWYKSKDPSGIGAKGIKGAYKSSYKPSTKGLGIYYFFCKVVNTKAGDTPSRVVVVSPIIAVRIGADFNKKTVTFSSLSKSLSSSSNVLEIYKSSKKSGTLLTYSKYKNTKNQKFMLLRDRYGLYRIKNVNSGLYLTVRQESRNSGAAIVQAKLSSSKYHAQRFRLFLNPDGSYRIVSKIDKKQDLYFGFKYNNNYAKYKVPKYSVALNFLDSHDSEDALALAIADISYKIRSVK